MTALERRRGLAAGALELIVLLESARGVWDIRSIITASPRITQVGLDESDLAVRPGFIALLDHVLRQAGQREGGAEPAVVSPPLEDAADQHVDQMHGAETLTGAIGAGQELLRDDLAIANKRR